MKVRADLGMVFQEGALFDSLTVAENVGYKLYEETDMPLDEVRAARRRGARASSGSPSTSTRCRRSCRAGSAGAWRLLAPCRFKPRILLYDEPTTGLDPITADTIDDEIIKLRDLENVSSIVVTHQLRDAFRIATHEAVRDDRTHPDRPADEKKAEEAEFIMLKDGRIHFEGHAAELRASHGSVSQSVSVIEEQPCHARVHSPGRNSKSASSRSSPSSWRRC